jgi:hypothetical protein
MGQDGGLPQKSQRQSIYWAKPVGAALHKNRPIADSAQKLPILHKNRWLNGMARKEGLAHLLPLAQPPSPRVLLLDQVR